MTSFIAVLMEKAVSALGFVLLSAPALTHLHSEVLITRSTIFK